MGTPFVSKSKPRFVCCGFMLLATLLSCMLGSVVKAQQVLQGKLQQIEVPAFSLFYGESKTFLVQGDDEFRNRDTIVMILRSLQPLGNLNNIGLEFSGDTLNVQATTTQHVIYAKRYSGGLDFFAQSIKVTCNSGSPFVTCTEIFTVRFYECGSCPGGFEWEDCNVPNSASFKRARLCTECPTLTVSDGFAGSTCQQCLTPLFHIPNEDQSACIPCPAGTFFDQSSCTDCPEGTYQPLTASDTCLPCLFGFTCPPGTITPTACARGFQRGGPNTCEICDDGFYCDGQGLDGNRQICPANNFCSNGQITACPADFSCPPGSIAIGSQCNGATTSSFIEDPPTCICFDGFSGQRCRVTTLSFGQVDFTDDTFVNASIDHLEEERIGDCACDSVYNGTDCVVAANINLAISTLATTGMRAYLSDQFDLGIFGISRAVECAYVQKIVPATRGVLEMTLAFLEGAVASDQGVMGDLSVDLHRLSVANAYILSLPSPGNYDFNPFFDPLGEVGEFSFEMLPPFDQCKSDTVVKRIEGGCGSSVSDFERWLAVARCAFLNPEDLASISLIPAETFLVQAAFCLRALSLKVDASKALLELNEIAVFLDSKLESTASTREAMFFVRRRMTLFEADLSNKLISVPAQPISFFEDNLGEKITSVQNSALRLDNADRFTNTIDALEQRSSELTTLLGNSFEGLANYLNAVNQEVLGSFKDSAEAEVASVQAELASVTDIILLLNERMKAAIDAMGTYTALLNGERVDKLLSSWQELIEIQFDFETASAAAVKAQATIDMIRSVLVGVVTIVATVAIGPVAGAVAGMAVAATALIPTRRLGEEGSELYSQSPSYEEMGQSINPDNAHTFRELVSVCGVNPAKIVDDVLPKLGAKAAKLQTQLKATFAGLPASTVGIINNVLGTLLVVFEAVDLFVPCSSLRDNGMVVGGFRFFLASMSLRHFAKADKSQLTKNFLTSPGGEDGQVGLAAVAMVLNSFSTGSEDLEGDLAAIVEENSEQQCSRRLLDEPKGKRELSICSGLSKSGVKISNLLKSPAFTGGAKAGSKALAKLSYGKMLGVASGLLDIGFGIKGYFDGESLAKELEAQAVQNQELNNQNVENAIAALRSKINLITEALLSIVLRLDFFNLGLSFDDIVNSEAGFSVDAFKLPPAIWDTLFHDIMDLVEYEALLCPQIENTGIVQLPERRRALDNRMSYKSEAVELRRSLNPKADLAKAKEEMKQARADFAKISERIEKVECPRFERTLRQVVDWGKAIHETFFEMIENLRRFELLQAQNEIRQNRVTAADERIRRSETAAKAFLASLPDDVARNFELRNTSVALADAEYKMLVMDLVEESLTLLQGFCNAHRYINPGKISPECESNPLAELQAGTTDYVDILFDLGFRMSAIKSAVKADWFDFAYDGFSDYDDELLPVTELIDLEQFASTGYSDFSFILNGPSAETDASNLTTATARSGPYFCGFENVGMTSFGVLFFDSDGNVIVSEDDIGVSITLSGPFHKTVGNKRYDFALKPYEDIPYAYSKPRAIGPSGRYCRTDENPTLHGELCDKSRSFNIEVGGGLDTQPLPSPYAKWDVRVVRGRELLQESGVANIQIIATFKASIAEEQLCILPRGGPLDVVAAVTSGESAGVTEVNDVFTDGSFAGGATVVAAFLAVAGVVFGVSRYRNQKSKSDPVGYVTEAPKTNSVENPRFEREEINNDFNI